MCYPHHTTHTPCTTHIHHTCQLYCPSYLTLCVLLIQVDKLFIVSGTSAKSQGYKESICQHWFSAVAVKVMQEVGDEVDKDDDAANTYGNSAEEISITLAMERCKYFGLSEFSNPGGDETGATSDDDDDDDVEGPLVPPETDEVVPKDAAALEEEEETEESDNEEQREREDESDDKDDDEEEEGGKSSESDIPTAGRGRNRSRRPIEESEESDADSGIEVQQRKRQMRSKPAKGDPCILHFSYADN